MPRVDKTKEKKVEKLPRKLAAIYCRVSTRNQGESGLSLENQRIRCTEYCERNDYEIVATYIDVASAKDLKRPEMDSLRTSARNNEFEVIVALKLDRISRVPRDFYNLIEEMNTLDKGVIIVEDHWETTTPAGRMMAGMLIQFAAFEREIGVERTKSAARQRASEGKPGGGKPPIGYDRKDKLFIINKPEAKIVKRIYDEYVMGIGPAKIAVGLNRDGFRTKTHHKTDGKFWGGNKEFNQKHIHDYITNPLYKGVIFHSGENFQGIHEAIVSREIWESAQEIVKYNAQSKNLGNSIRDQHILAGLVKCEICGDLISVYGGTGKQKKVYHYYQCLSARSTSGRNECNNRAIRTEHLESIVADVIRQIAVSDNFFESVNAELDKKIKKEDLEEIELNIARTSAEKQKTQTEIKNLVKVLAQNKVKDSAPIQDELNLLQKQLSELTSYLSKLTNDLQRKTLSTESKDELLHLYQEFDKIWDSLTRTDQGDVIKLLVEEILVNNPKNDDKGSITLYLYNKPPVSSLSEITGGSHVYSLLLRGEGKVKKPFQVHGKLLNTYYNQSVTSPIKVKIAGQNLSIFMPIRGNSRTRCETNAHRLTKSDRRELENRKKEARTEEYIRLLERYDLSRAELARRLGVSRAWVTTVLQGSDN